MLRSSFGEFQRMDEEAKNKKDKDLMVPYLFEFYNVLKFDKLASNGIKSVLVSLINSLINAINERACLPRYIVFILDKDILEEINVWAPEAAMYKALSSTLNWIMRQVSIITRRWKMEITERNPGAVFGSDPKVIFTKMLRRAEYYPKESRLEKLNTARPRFTDCVNEAAAKYDYHIINITVCNLPEYYDLKDKLSVKGKQTFWQEMDHLMELFDRNEIQLLPARTQAEEDSSPMRKLLTTE